MGTLSSVILIAATAIGFGAFLTLATICIFGLIKTLRNPANWRS